MISKIIKVAARRDTTDRFPVTVDGEIVGHVQTYKCLGSCSMRGLVDVVRGFDLDGNYLAGWSRTLDEIEDETVSYMKRKVAEGLVARLAGEVWK